MAWLKLFNQSVYCKLVNQCKTLAAIPYGSIDARMIVVNALGTQGFAWLFNAGSFASNCSRPLLVLGRLAGDAAVSSSGSAGSVERLRPEDANCGLLDEQRSRS